MSTIDLIFMYYFLGLAVLWIILKIRERLQLTTLKTGDWQNQLADDVLLFWYSFRLSHDNLYLLINFKLISQYNIFSSRTNYK